MITNTQEVRNLVKIPNDLLKEKDKEDHIDNCIYVDKKKIIDNIEKSSKMFKIGNELYIVRKFESSYIINGNIGFIIIIPKAEYLYYYLNDSKEYKSIYYGSKKLCVFDDRGYSLIRPIFNYYK